MKKNKEFVLEKATIRDNIWAMKGIRIPVLFLILIFGAALLSTYAGMKISLFTGNMVDAGGNVPTNKLISFSISYLLIALAAVGNVIFSAFASEKINFGLRTKLWRKIMYSKQKYYGKDSGESLVSRVTSDCDYASKLITTIVAMLGTVVSLGLYINMMLKLNEKLSLAMIWLVPVTVLFGWGYAKLHFIIAQKKQAMLAGTTTYLVEHTKNLDLIKTSGTQAEEVRKGYEHFNKQYKIQIKTSLMSVAYNFLQHLFEMLSIFIPFVIGAQLVENKIIKVGIVIAFYSVARSVGVVATNFISDVGLIRQANGALARVIKVLRFPDEHDSKGLTMDVPDKDITIEEVSFDYGDKRVLDKISCTIPKNKVTALIGANGSGKSTLFKLLDRLIDPSEGQITFGDTPANEYDLFEWRKAFCLVAQDSPLMEGTIRENICYGCRRTVSDEELETAARKTRVYDFVSRLPDGLESKVTIGGSNLSGGQKQLIAICRAMMNNPDYLLLDEATSNLDAHSERDVLAALEELMKDRTTVIIAHSLSAIKNADHVIILHDGKLEGTGSPDQVLKTTDSYLMQVANRRMN